VLVNTRLFAVVAALIPAFAFADVDSKFADMRDKAKPLGSLGAFLDSYVGQCTDPFSGPECKNNSADYRKKANGHAYYMIIHEEAATMLSAGPYNPQTGEFTINVTPFFGANGYAVTQGAPKRADANGNPILPFIQVKGKVSQGWSGTRFNSLFMRRGLRLQIVFTPQDLWALPKGSGGKNYGVKARIDAMLITEGRSGEVMGVWYGPK
jgi:hypothetical protein